MRVFTRIGSGKIPQSPSGYGTSRRQWAFAGPPGCAASYLIAVPGGARAPTRFLLVQRLLFSSTFRAEPYQATRTIPRIWRVTEGFESRWGHHLSYKQLHRISFRPLPSAHEYTSVVSKCSSHQFIDA